MNDPLAVTPIEVVFGISIYLSIVATIALYRSFRNTRVGIVPALLGLALTWLVPVVGPLIVLATVFLDARKGGVRTSRQLG